MSVSDSDKELAELLLEVRRITVSSRRLVTNVMAGGYTSAFRGTGIEFEEVREFVEGDDPRAIDWNVTARVGRPYVKKYVDERELSVLFALDLSASLSAGFGRWSARQTAARVLACLAISAVQNDDKVGFLARGGETEHFVPLKKGMSHALRIVRDTLALPCVGSTDLAAFADSIRDHVRRRSVVFLISDFLAADHGPALARLAARHDVVAVRLLGRERELPRSGLVRLFDPESKEVVILDSGHAATRQAYGERVDVWNRATADLLTKCGVDLLDVPLPREHERDPIVGPLLRFFRMRQQRGAKR